MKHKNVWGLTAFPFYAIVFSNYKGEYVKKERKEINKALEERFQESIRIRLMILQRKM